MNATESNTDRLLADLKRIVADSEALLQSGQDAAGDKAQEVRERLADAVESAKRSCRRLEEKALEGVKATDRAVHDHPYQAMGIAFGVGLLIGVLVTRK